MHQWAHATHQWGCSALVGMYISGYMHQWAVHRFPSLQRQLAVSVLEFIRSGADPAERMIGNLIECEHDFINCDHPEFIGGRGAIRAVMQDRALRATQGAARAKEGPSHSAPAGSAVSGLLSRNRISHPKDAAEGFSRGTGSVGSHPIGLKGLPEPSAFSADELLTRTRRHGPSDTDEIVSLAGHNPISHLHHHPSCASYPLLAGGASHLEHAMVLGTGRDAADRASSSSLPHPSHNHTPSWFSWFSRGGDNQGGGAGEGGAGVHGGHELLALGGSGRLLDAGRDRTRRSGGPYGHGSIAASSGLQEQDEIEVEVIRKLVDSYFAIVQRNLQDGVPKAIMHFMVNNTKRGLQQHLIQQLYREDLLEELLCEREDVVAQRSACKEAIQVLNAAVQALEELPNTLHAMGGPRGIVMQPASSRGLLGQRPSSPLPNFFTSNITRQDVFSAPRMPPPSRHNESAMQGAHHIPTRASNTAAKPTTQGTPATSLPPQPPPFQASTPPGRQQQAQAESLPQGLHAIESIS
ncbi:Dynamin GTPase effector domain-containing protein [Dunaliella salina]|uniref:Dynamin GTPase effector domain-containing protein n=1 Tax=Dunaliella salina TaxID=3046 RepID=A0ABQ7G6H7_DUNSA|nr:Dynamin GTPase effector domain-containing protein [Dunaliella salina]|eukprot:KAF5830210.1 Dynamin GTPase effector domain-containing protein [Dunaliella salina]